MGVSRSTFYHFCSHHPDAIASYQEMQLLAKTQQYALILENETKVLERVIEEALAGTTKPRHRLAIYKMLTKRMEELLEDLRVNSRDGKDAADFLTDPKLERAVSRFLASESEINPP